MSRTVVAAAGLAMLCFVSGCSGSSDGAATDAPTTAASATPTTSDLAAFPEEVVATPIRHHYVELPVSSADLSQVIRVQGSILAALADDGAFFGQVYPVISTDDGGEWRIEGPRFAKAAACGPCTTDHLDVSSDGTLMAWGHGGSTVKASNDLGRQWFQAGFGSVATAHTHGTRLVVRAMGPQQHGRFPTCRYVSSDGGQTWNRRGALPSVPY